ncbi:unnamed protein product [Closterium sp. NIES-64]|nr:unnamed protein product [Closterium sp. NIES-64]
MGTYGSGARGGAGAEMYQSEVNNTMFVHYVRTIVQPMMLSLKKVVDPKIKLELKVGRNNSREKGIVEESKKLKATSLVIGTNARGMFSMRGKSSSTGAYCVRYKPPGISVYVIQRDKVILYKESEGSPVSSSTGSPSGSGPMMPRPGPPGGAGSGTLEPTYSGAFSEQGARRGYGSDESSPSGSGTLQPVYGNPAPGGGGSGGLAHSGTRFSMDGGAEGQWGGGGGGGGGSAGGAQKSPGGPNDIQQAAALSALAWSQAANSQEGQRLQSDYMAEFDAWKQSNQAATYQQQQDFMSDLQARMAKARAALAGLQLGGDGGSGTGSPAGAGGGAPGAGSGEMQARPMYPAPIPAPIPDGPATGGSGGQSANEIDLRRELELMRQRAAEAEQARLEAEQRAQRALSEADRSLREVEAQNKRRELETAVRIEMASQEASRAIAAAEEARKQAGLEAQKTEVAMKQAAMTRAALEMESQKRAAVELKAKGERGSQRMAANYRDYSYEDIVVVNYRDYSYEDIVVGGVWVWWLGWLCLARVRCGVLWGAVLWCAVLCCGVLWCGVLWCDVLWCGVLWCAVVRCGVVCCGVLWDYPAPPCPNPPQFATENFKLERKLGEGGFSTFATDNFKPERELGAMSPTQGTNHALKPSLSTRIPPFNIPQFATENFKPERKLGEGGFGTVFSGTLHHTPVAVKVLKNADAMQAANEFQQEVRVACTVFSGTLHHTPVAVKVLKNADAMQAANEFQQEVEVLSQIQHPHVVMLLGCCPSKYCLVYEFMANGSLEDRLLCANNTPPLPWYIRMRVAAEIASALLILHTRPVPIVHRDLKPGNILLDKNFVAKLGDVGLAKLMPGLSMDQTYMRESVPVGTFAYVDPEFQRTGEFGPKSDVYALGIVLLDLLTGRKPNVYEGLEEAVDDGDENELKEFLDERAGDWPLDMVMEVARIAVKCSEMRRKKRPDLEKQVMPVLDRARARAAKAEEEARKAPSRRPMGEAPSVLFCPITQEMMVNPVLAADGHTYEQEAIKSWLETSDMSPMTNQKLPSKDLVPNHAVERGEEVEGGGEGGGGGGEMGDRGMQCASLSKTGASAMAKNYAAGGGAEEGGGNGLGVC